MSAILELVNVSKTYTAGSHTVRAVDDVSLRIEPGEFVALVGPSGSGKTTLLALLAGLLTPTSGQVLIDGQDLSGMSEAARTAFRRRNIGFAFQSNNLVPYLTALENVALMLQLNGAGGRQGGRQARPLLERLGLGEHLGHLPAQLSGGQQQRVAIARALVHEPALVLADEPTASLDTERAFQVVQALADLVHEQGRAGIMVTHDLRMCRAVDRVISMEDGRIEQIFDPALELEVGHAALVQAAGARGDAHESAARYA